ncbi:polysaccharide export protein [Candidatus Poribacteria bacterium]|nr:polysaccharide export protein [Candidatus Poribacteria bacterium]
MNKIKYIIILIISVLFIKINIKAEEPKPQYTISNMDELYIDVWGKADFTKCATVRNDGYISFSPLGDILASGKTPSTLAQEIAHRLEEFIEKPLVTISIDKSRGNKISILGGVHNPGEYYYNENISLLEVIAGAGGINLFADEAQSIKIIRNDKTLSVQLSSLLKAEKIQDNIILKNNDIIIVPTNVESFIEKFKNIKSEINFITINEKK